MCCRARRCSLTPLLLVTCHPPFADNLSEKPQIQSDTEPEEEEGKAAVALQPLIATLLALAAVASGIGARLIYLKQQVAARDERWQLARIII